MLDWEEGTFLGLKSLYERFFARPKEEKRAARAANLADRRVALMLLGRMIAGTDIDLFETDHDLMALGDRICLPPTFDEGLSVEANAGLYEVKTVLAAFAIRHGLYDVAPEEVFAKAEVDFPFLGEKIAGIEEQLEEGVTFWELIGEAEPADLQQSQFHETQTPELDEGHELMTEIEGRGQVDVEVLAGTDDDGDGANLPVHTFEKIETLEETSGLRRRSDDEDELEEHEEALSEVDMTQVIRSPERPQSIYRSDIILDGLGIEVRDEGIGQGIPYPEWDYKKRQYRENWCFLQVDHPDARDAEWALATGAKHEGLIRRLNRQLASIISDYLRLCRQPIGDEFDLDALVDAQVALKMGRSPDERLYVDRKRDLHDVAALILLDTSFSTDGWVNNQRVLDTIREMVFCLGEVSHESIAEFGVARFYSNTRRSCHFSMIKDFHEPWAIGRERLGSIDPQGYTRIGPALRHAHELLLPKKAAHKMVILVTDGRPCDYDRYEGRYGILDVRKAIDTGRDHGIHTHAFAIDREAYAVFPQMFRRDHYDVVQKPDGLAETMSRVFARVLAS